MKQYGFNKATEFTKKQINVIFAKAKNNELKVEKWVMKDFYELADYYGYDDNRSIEEKEQFIKSIINNMFDGKIEETQKEIDFYTKKYENSFSRKKNESLDRNLVK